MPNIVPNTVLAPAVIPVVRQETTIREDEWGVGPLFNHGQGQMELTDSNDLLLGNEAQTLSQRITNILITERFKYNIYLSSFGSDFVLLQGQRFDPIILKSLAEGMVRQAFKQANDSRIQSVGDFRITVQGSKLFIRFKIVTPTGYSRQFEGVWSV